MRVSRDQVIGRLRVVAAQTFHCSKDLIGVADTIDAIEQVAA